SGASARTRLFLETSVNQPRQVLPRFVSLTIWLRLSWYFAGVHDVLHGFRRYVGFCRHLARTIRTIRWPFRRRGRNCRLVARVELRREPVEAVGDQSLGEAGKKCPDEQLCVFRTAF